MKYEGTRPSGVDKDVMVYKFVLGKDELRILAASLSKAKSTLLKMPETQQIHDRLRNMIKVVGKAFEGTKENDGKS
jgi:hypothetical protein